MQRCAEHPLTAVLSRKAIAADKAGSAATDPIPSETHAGEDREDVLRERQLSDLAREGGAIRRRFNELPDEAAKLMDETTRLLKLEGSQRRPPAEVRMGRARADRLVRAAAPLWHGRQSDVDPTRTLRNLDLHYLLLWHTRRTIDDFWGPNPTAASSMPFFQIAADDYLRSARELCLGDPLQRELRELLSLREEAAEKAVSPDKPADVFFDEDGLPIRHTISARVAENLPPGTAALYLQDRQQRLFPLQADSREADPRRPSPELRRMAVSVSAAAAARLPDYWIPNGPRLREESELQAVALYRGHRRPSSTCYVQPARGTDIILVRPKYPAPTVVVTGTAGDPMPVMLVLDCSASMDKPSSRETRPGVAPDSGSGRKIDVAKAAVLRILEGLVDQPYNVGLMAYGHRTEWRAGGKGYDVFPPGLDIHPNNDVAEVLPIAQRTRLDAGKRQLVNSLEPHGETPLYLAIIRAMEKLPPVGRGNEKHVVVITDGVNNQGPDPKGPVADRKKAIHVADALKLAAHRGVRLDIVGFHIDRDKLDDDGRQSLKNLEDLVRACKGTMTFADDETSLVTALRSSLPVSRYTVETVPDGDPITPKPLLLKQTCDTIPKPNNGAVEYLVKLVDLKQTAQATIVVEGGEALQLAIQEALGERRLVHARYTWQLELDASETVSAMVDGSPRTFFIGAHLPQVKGRAMAFQISVQNGDAEQFSPRPKEAWVRIRPDLPAGHPEADTAYTLYDLYFVPERPVPVLGCRVPNWPDAAETAKIEVWCKLQKTDPDKQIRVADFAGEDTRIAGLPTVDFSLITKRRAKSSDPLDVIITERHAEGSGLDLVKVEMDPRSPPDRIKHRYDRDNHAVVHTFSYYDASEAEVAGYRVLLTSRKRLTDDAIQLSKPLSVTLPED